MASVTHEEVIGAGAVAARRRRQRKATGRIAVCIFGFATFVGIAILFVLLLQVAIRGLPHLSWEFITGLPSRFASKAGLLPALAGTMWVMAFTAVLSFPVATGTAIYLEEYAPKNRVTALIQMNVANLAGVPSIVYGMLGLMVFVRWMALGQSVLAAALTMTLLILPISIIASREAIRAVPRSLVEAAYALGATKWQTVRAVVIPYAFPGILTGTILSMSRAIGETAPLIVIGGLTYVAFLPGVDGLAHAPLDRFTVLPIQVFNWASRPQAAFQDLAATGICVLLVVLLAMNATAILLRDRLQKKSMD